MSASPFFWLHIKKSAGMTIRSLLHPHYVEVDRTRRPKTFIQATPEEYNDILNNYRVVLGEYQFKRCLFAKTFLYPESWSTLYSFAFVREPTDRCVSMFHYLFWRDGTFLENLLQTVCRSISRRKLLSSTHYAFDVFLEYVQDARTSDSVFHPLGLHFSTHTAPMSPDVTDHEGKVLLRAVHRLDSLVQGLNTAFETCGLTRRLEANDIVINKHCGRGKYAPSLTQRRRIRSIYDADFELYESCGR